MALAAVLLVAELAVIAKGIAVLLVVGRTCREQGFQLFCRLMSLIPSEQYTCTKLGRLLVAR